jgi:hypothetical protein
LQRLLIYLNEESKTRSLNVCRVETRKPNNNKKNLTNILQAKKLIEQSKQRYSYMYVLCKLTGQYYEIHQEKPQRPG